MKPLPILGLVLAAAAAVAGLVHLGETQPATKHAALPTPRTYVAPRATATPASQSTLTVSYDLGERWLKVQGDIDPGASAKLRSALAKMPLGSKLVLNSRGGDIEEALVMANDIQRTPAIAKVVVYNEGCNSACVLLFAAVQNRVVIADAQVGIHRARTVNDTEDETSQFATEVYTEFLTAHGMPPALVAKLKGTAPTSMYAIPDKSLRSWGVRVARCQGDKPDTWRPCP